MPTRSLTQLASLSVQESRDVSNQEQQQQLMAEGSEAADFIRTSIVQAAMNDRGTYGASCIRRVCCIVF